MGHDYEATCFQCGVPVGLDEPREEDVFCSADCQIYYEYKKLIRSNIDLKLKPLRWFTIYRFSGRIVAIVRAESELAAEQTLCAMNPDYTPDDCAAFITKEVDCPVYTQITSFNS